MKRCSCISVTLVVSIALNGIAQDEIRFAQHIQPIFAEHCLQCHGHDAQKREADLRLDVESSVKSTAVIPGDPGASPLFERVTSPDPDLRMPPGEGKALHAEQIESIRQWIAAGANFETHWAFEPIEDAAPPNVDSNEEGLSDIDKFVMAKLQASGLRLTKPASKRQLIRRATFDLTGLPPTWEDVVAFVDDDSPSAFEKVVDRLLASKAYGERWGRHWLDIARYADTYGGAAIGFKKFAFSYTYRDYIIRAFNEDLPYNRFITEQLAADQMGLPDNAEQLAALGFLTVGMQFRNPHDTIDDQIDVVTRGLMGLTVACARCHDHKYDAIPTKDYYALYATLASSKQPDLQPLVGAPQPSDQLDEYNKKLSQLQIAYENMARDQSEVMRARLRVQIGMYLREIAKGIGEEDLSTTGIFSYRTDDLRPPVVQHWRRYIKNMPKDDPVFGIWLILAKLPADDFKGHCVQVVEELRKQNGEVGKDFHRLSATPPTWNPRVLDAIADKQPASMLEVADAYGVLFGDVQREWLTAQLEAALEAIPGTKPLPDEDPKHLTINSPVNQQLRRHLYGSDSPVNMNDALASKMLNRPISDNLNGRKGSIHSLNLNAPGSPPRAMVLVESQNPGAFFVFNRGNPIDRGAQVQPRFLTALGGNNENVFELTKRRLSLAKSIVDPANPLSRRVVVNWVWQRHFGRGLVRTPDDFGTRGDLPTHPKLLDYLATRLLEDGWSIKSLHRRIMLTDAYQQGSLENTVSRAADPNNLTLWRMPRRRLELEAMRDAMLSVSSELQLEDDGGRPFDLLSTPTVPRRSVYAFVNRDIVAPLLSTFDAANPNACTAMRPQTTVPQQTLFALNSEFIQDRAEEFAENVLTSLNNPEASDIVTAFYRKAFSRDPNELELNSSIRFLQEAKSAETARSQLAHVLLAANEFVFVD